MQTIGPIERIILALIFVALLAVASKALLGESTQSPTELLPSSFWLSTADNCTITPLTPQQQVTYGEICPSTLYDPTTSTAYHCDNDASYHCATLDDIVNGQIGADPSEVECTGQCVPCGRPINCTTPTYTDFKGERISQ